MKAFLISALMMMTTAAFAADKVVSADDKQPAAEKTDVGFPNLEDETAEWQFKCEKATGKKEVWVVEFDNDLYCSCLKNKFSCLP